MSKQERIRELYFNEGYKQKEIANILEISTSYVSKILLKDNIYQKEKEKRKDISKQRHRKSTIDYMQNKRKVNNIDIEYEQLKQRHLQDSQELSGKSYISNRAFRDWNSSIYKYNNNTKSYYLKKGIIVGHDVPKRINWKSY